MLRQVRFACALSPYRDFSSLVNFAARAATANKFHSILCILLSNSRRILYSSRWVASSIGVCAGAKIRFRKRWLSADSTSFVLLRRGWKWQQFEMSPLYTRAASLGQKFAVRSLPQSMATQATPRISITFNHYNQMELRVLMEAQIDDRRE